MTNQEVLEIAMEQSAADLNCRAEDFMKDEPVVVKGGIGPGVKNYYQEPVSANLVSYGNNIVASVKEEYREIIEEYLHKFTFYQSAFLLLCLIQYPFCEKQDQKRIYPCLGGDDDKAGRDYSRYESVSRKYGKYSERKGLSISR